MLTPNQRVSNFPNDKNIIICRFSQLFLKNISFENKEEQYMIATTIYELFFFNFSMCKLLQQNSARCPERAAGMKLNVNKQNTAFKQVGIHIYRSFETYTVDCLFKF